MYMLLNTIVLLYLLDNILHTESFYSILLHYVFFSLDCIFAIHLLLYKRQFTYFYKSIVLIILIPQHIYLFIVGRHLLPGFVLLKSNTVYMHILVYVHVVYMCTDSSRAFLVTEHGYLWLF